MKPGEELKLSKDFLSAVELVRIEGNPTITILKGILEECLKEEGKDALYEELEGYIELRALTECAMLKDLGVDLEPYMDAYVRKIAWAYGYKEE